jgi:hypothetical protein
MGTGCGRVWDAATGEALGWRADNPLQGEVVTWHEPSGELLAASEVAWRWLGWVGAIVGEPVRLPTETFGPLPAM